MAASSPEELEVVVERVEGGIAAGTARQYVTVRWPLVGERRGGLAQVRVVASDGETCFGVRATTFRRWGDEPPPYFFERSRSTSICMVQSQLA
ncbi:MAG TPA: hypothetical protein VFI16_04765 [Anaeromyxobacteraceae bacterium]|nr:hypothetical protein [Anaeromyxobacteraceae bacterium]